MLHAFLTSTPDQSQLSFSRFLGFASKERHAGTHWVRGWLGPDPQNVRYLKVILLGCVVVASGKVTYLLRFRTALIFSVSDCSVRRNMPGGLNPYQHHRQNPKPRTKLSCLCRKTSSDPLIIHFEFFQLLVIVMLSDLEGFCCNRSC